MESLIGLLTTQPEAIVADPRLALLFFLFFLWPIPWKAIAAWKAARNGQMLWFFAILLLNTAAILEIVYLAFFQRRAPTTPPQQHSPHE